MLELAVLNIYDGGPVRLWREDDSDIERLYDTILYKNLVGYFLKESPTSSRSQ